MNWIWPLADRNKPHIIIEGFSTSTNYIGRSGGPSKVPSPVSDHREHAERVIAMIDEIQVVPNASATYIEVLGRAGEPFLSEKFNVSGLSVLSKEDAQPEQEVPGHAVVRVSVPDHGLQKLRRKFRDFRDKIRAPNRSGIRNRYNADLANSVDRIGQATIQQLWRHPSKPFPVTEEPIPWEVWLAPSQVNKFKAMARSQGIEVYPDQLFFPEDTVVLVVGDRFQIERTALGTGAVKAISPLGKYIDFVEDLDSREQIEWIEDLLNRANFNESDDDTTSYVTLLDTGISLSNSLIQPALDDKDRHVADLAWDRNDNRGHGTKMAGLALFGDLRPVLGSNSSVPVSHRLESSKVIPDAGENPHHLLGNITQKAINAVEVEPNRIRTFALASTTGQDTPHSGAPTSWSSEIDQLAAGVSGTKNLQRLIVISIGNISPQHEGTANYLAKCDDVQAEIESPAQAWNAIAVGAMTEMNGIGGPTFGNTLAKKGDLAPMSRTASWKNTWPIKPDVVLEGGNWYDDGFSTPSTHSDLMLVTTSRNVRMRSFAHMSDTSAATALASRELAILRSEYPDLWPETIRALYVFSARWTNQMLSHVTRQGQQRKRDLNVLFQRYGFGRPDINRALRSADNAITLIAQDTIRPYTLHNRNGRMNEMKLFNLPWPVNVLRGLQDTKVNLRVALSTFIQPNPSEVARGRNQRYASHGLRFALKHADEDINQFTRRVSHVSTGEDHEISSPDGKGWQFGYFRRSVGSLHIDALTIPASDLARMEALAVYPVGGWWKDSRKVELVNNTARFALVVEIDAGANDVNLYTEIQQRITEMAAIPT